MVRRDVRRRRGNFSYVIPLRTYRGRKAALSVARANELRQRAAAGEVKTRLAREFGITRQTLYAYLTRQPFNLCTLCIMCPMPNHARSPDRVGYGTPGAGEKQAVLAREFGISREALDQYAPVS
jgi:DNA-binding XRE family transcriptional regulator